MLGRPSNCNFQRKKTSRKFKKIAHKSCGQPTVEARRRHIGTFGWTDTFIFSRLGQCAHVMSQRSSFLASPPPPWWALMKWPTPAPPRWASLVNGQTVVFFESLCFLGFLTNFWEQIANQLEFGVSARFWESARSSRKCVDQSLS